MKNLHTFPFALFATMASTVHALSNITAPSQVTAEVPFTISYQNSDTQSYRVYLAASLAGQNGPTCYLLNNTLLTSSPLTLTVPADVGPSASYYSIAIAPASDAAATAALPPSYSNTFALAAANGTYSAYEDHLGGAEFWDADALPCSAYACARACAQSSYPADRTQTPAYATMVRCMLTCPGVAAQVSQTAPALAASTAAAATVSVPPDGGMGATTTTSSKNAGGTAWVASGVVMGVAGLAVFL